MCSNFLPLFVPALEPEHELFLVYGKGRPGIIRGMDMGAKVPDEHMIPIENLMNPRALDFHAETGFIYFADTTSYLIGRQKIDGTERETILKDGEGLLHRKHTDRIPQGPPPPLLLHGARVGPWLLSLGVLSARRIPCRLAGWAGWHGDDGIDRVTSV